jgi:hypothetical protein
MKKKFLLIAITTAILALTITPMVAFAQDQETTAVARPIRDGLAIVAPRTAAVGQLISMTVFQCSDQTPVAGAGVWAVTPDRVESLKEEMSNLKNISPADQDKKSEELLGIHGIFIGRTDATGKVWHTFNTAGSYMLVTFKPGYWPDMRMIVVGKPAGTIPRLVIDAPDKAEVGEKITITVTEKVNQEPVKDAGVWALSREKAEAIKAQFSAQSTATDQDALAAQVENTLNLNGIFLGNTNGAGKLNCAFENAGGYLLVTVKRGYLPSYRPILIGSTPKVLSIDAPSKAKVGEKITITVTEKNSQDTVKDAGVWALTRENALSVKSQMDALKTTGDTNAILSQVESTLNIHGIFLGTTNGAGKVQYAFENAGGYVLVTFKPGYWPGFKPILIISEQLKPTTSNTTATLK